MAGAVQGFHSASPALASKPFAPVAPCACSGSNWPRLPLRRNDVGSIHGAKWTGRTGRERHRSPVFSSATAHHRHDSNPQNAILSQWQVENGGEEFVNQPRRRVMQTGAAIALLGVVDCWPVLAEPGEREAESQESGQAASKPKAAALADTESWYRVRGDGFAMSVPPNYEDIVEYDESGNSLYGERAKEKPFLARFASPDRKEVLSVVARNSTQLKLSFLQTQDITEFGSLEEAARIFVPAGSKIVAAATRKPTDSRVPRTYYLYEFLAKDDKHVVMSAAAAGGRVFVFGAMAPSSRWKEVGSIMRSAALNFALR